jgi:hypothetical protein
MSVHDLRRFRDTVTSRPTTQRRGRGSAAAGAPRRAGACGLAYLANHSLPGDALVGGGFGGAVMLFRSSAAAAWA